MLAVLARLTEVQGLERYRPRRLANDLTRPRLGVEIFEAETDDDGAVTGVSKTDYLDLTGNRIYVNINDTGVDDNDAFGRRFFGLGITRRHYIVYNTYFFNETNYRVYRSCLSIFVVINKYTRCIRQDL